MLEKEFKYYLTHQTELVQKYNDKYLVIINEEVVGIFDKQNDAYNQSKEKYKLGTFLIQHCSPGNVDYTQTYHSRVSFNI